MNDDIDDELYITNLIEADILQELQDAFSNMTGLAALTTDMDGKPVTKGSNFTDFCFKYTRSSPIGCSRCEQSDRQHVAQSAAEGRAVVYRCHAGLVDFSAPIMVGDKCVGCFVGGQTLAEPYDRASVISTANDIGVDSEDYLAAIQKIRVIKKEAIEKAANFLYTIANMISNITYNKYQIMKSNQEIQKAANMKSDFLANMSHEIRTPMNAVIGMAELALREELPPAAREYITQIKASGKTLLNIINDILDFSKIEAGKFDITVAEYEPMSIINDVANIIMTRLIDKDVELILDIDPTIPSDLIGDSNRLKQIIVNLTNNAAKFTKKGKIVLSAAYNKKSHDELELLISVSDTGIGIKKEDLGKLFQSFQQLDSKRNRNIEGTGLGLAISKSLLQLMHGSITVESEYNVGSTFSFRLPQLISNAEPSVLVEDAASINASAIIANPHILEQLRKDISRLGANFIDMTSDRELDRLLSENVSFLFIENDTLTDKIEQFLLDNPQITGVLIVDFNANTEYNIPNFVVVKKPVYSLNIASLFNHEVLYGNNGITETDFDFIAPEANILIVDDNAINLTVAEGLLEPLRMNIDTSTSGVDAIKKVSSKKYDIIFMDHMMPEVDGIETTHIIRRFHPEYNRIPIIALTANAVEGTRKMFLAEGMNDFIPKPIEMKVILSKLKRWLPKDKIQKNVADKKQPAPKEEKSDIVIEGLDTKYALSLLGNEKLFWAVLKDYYNSIPKKIQIVKDSIFNEQWRNYTIEVHAIKSSSNQVGAIELSKAAAELEKAGNNLDIIYILKHTDDMLKQYEHYHEILEPYFRDDMADSSAQKDSINKDTLKEFFFGIREAIDNLDIDAMEKVLDEMRQFSYPDRQQALLEKLREAIEEIDVDACEEILQKWEKELS